MFKMTIEGVSYVLLKEEDYLNGTAGLKEISNRVIDSLTFMELEGAKGLFEKLGNETEIDIVLAKLADELSISRASMSLMLRKLEGNRIVESFNMGAKGTRITVLNKEFKNMIAKI